MTNGQLAIHLADVSLYFALGQSWLRRTAGGEALMARFESGVAGWVHNRASNAVLDDVRALKQFLGWSSALGLVVAAAGARAGVPALGASLAPVVLIGLWGWVSLEWTFDHRSLAAALRSPLAVAEGLLACGVTAAIARVGLDAPLRALMLHAGVAAPGELQISAAVGALMLLAVAVAYLAGWVVFGGIALLITGGIFLASELARFVSARVRRDVAWLLMFVLAGLVRLVKPFV